MLKYDDGKSIENIIYDTPKTWTPTEYVLCTSKFVSPIFIDLFQVGIDQFGNLIVDFCVIKKRL